MDRLASNPQSSCVRWERSAVISPRLHKPTLHNPMRVYLRVNPTEFHGAATQGTGCGCGSAPRARKVEGCLRPPSPLATETMSEPGASPSRSFLTDPPPPTSLLFTQLHRDTRRVATRGGLAAAEWGDCLPFQRLPAGGSPAGRSGSAPGSLHRSRARGRGEPRGDALPPPPPALLPVLEATVSPTRSRTPSSMNSAGRFVACRQTEASGGAGGSGGEGVPLGGGGDCRRVLEPHRNFSGRAEVRSAAGAPLRKQA